MKFTTRLFFLFAVLMVSYPTLAQVSWSEPEVLKIRLRKPNRRIVRFSGKTKPNAVVRIRNNKIKLYLDNGKARVVQIPQKDKVQFPITASGDGRFAFQLYLPTTAIEIPVQVKANKKWRTSPYRYRVPGSGYADDFRATEESFRATDQKISRIERKDNYYSRKYDKGMVIGDGRGGKEVKDSNIQAWVGIGVSYFDNSIDSTGIVNVSASDSSFSIPTFRLGADFKWSNDLLIKTGIRSTSGSTDDITGGNAAVTGKDFNWFEFQASGVWFLQKQKKNSGRLGLDLGFQLQRVPFFRERPEFANYAYFDNSVYVLQIGVFYLKPANKIWGYGYEMYARYLYPISTGDAFDMNTSFPLMFEFGGGIRKRFTPSMSFGVFGQLHYHSMAVKYSNTNPAREYGVDLSMALLTIDGRLIVDF